MMAINKSLAILSRNVEERSNFGHNLVQITVVCSCSVPSNRPLRWTPKTTSKICGITPNFILYFVINDWAQRIAPVGFVSHWQIFTSWHYAQLALWMQK